MYYFLAHKLLSLGGDKDKLKTIADNTFLLALDGDVDFQPSALRLLVDRMKRNPHVGAACGRIHPIGSGAYFLFLEEKPCCPGEVQGCFYILKGKHKNIHNRSLRLQKYM